MKNIKLTHDLIGLNPLSNQGHSITGNLWINIPLEIGLNPLSNQGHSIGVKIWKQ